MTKWVYAFGDGKAEGKAEMRNLLGGKGANLAEMSNLGLPVPPGLTVTTEVCTYYYAHGETYPADLKEQVATALREVGYQAKGNFGDPDKPLLLSVRSGARVSMPGMMDTVLNLGLNATTTAGLAQLTGDEQADGPPPNRAIGVENVTVLAGTVALGMGETFDESKMTTAAVGAYASLPAEMRHYFMAKSAATVQVHGQGPFVVNYVNPADDPSKQTK